MAVTGNLPSLSRANVYGGFATPKMNPQPPQVPNATAAQSAAYQPMGGIGSAASWVVLVALLVLVRVLYEYAD
jgi:hypothetical protein